jgi:hypothetical protein
MKNPEDTGLDDNTGKPKGSAEKLPKDDGE